MIWLVFGAAGQVGQALLTRLQDAGQPAHGLDRTSCDIRDVAQVRAALQHFDPAVVVNAAAWTNVDAAEGNEAAAFEVNARGAGNVADAVAASNAVLLHLSTDYVFDGTAAPVPYAEDTRQNPTSAYGRSKAAGETLVQESLSDRGYIIRTAWVHGPNTANFVTTMRMLERKREFIEVVADQFGAPTYTVDLADTLYSIGKLATQAPLTERVLHVTNTGITTWWEFAQAIFIEVGADPARVQPIESARLDRPAPRPAWSVLGHDALTRARLPLLPAWSDGLARHLVAIHDLPSAG